MLEKWKFLCELQIKIAKNVLFGVCLYKMLLIQNKEFENSPEFHQNVTTLSIPILVSFYFYVLVMDL